MHRRWERGSRHTSIFRNSLEHDGRAMPTLRPSHCEPACMRTSAQTLFPPPEFAETAPLHEAVYLGRPDAFAPPPLRVFGCGCGKAHLQRIERSWWMRLLPTFALYQCLSCARRVLRPRV